MVYPWSKKPKEEVEEPETEIREDKVESFEEIKEDNREDVQESEDSSIDEENVTEEVVNSLILNILKLEGYKMDSGELFQAFREAGGEMENFKSELDKLSVLGKIKSDSDGKIMTVQDYQQEKSRQDDDDTEVSIEEAEDNTETEDGNSEEESEDEDIESIIKLKEETDNWLIEQLKNKENIGNNEDLRTEIAELKERVQKLENVIKNMNKAFE